MEKNKERIKQMTRKPKLQQSKEYDPAQDPEVQQLARFYRFIESGARDPCFQTGEECA